MNYKGLSLIFCQSTALIIRVLMSKWICLTENVILTSHNDVDAKGQLNIDAQYGDRHHDACYCDNRV